jgi:TP901 family phage tail tape measure protein
MFDEHTFKSTYDIMVELGNVWDSLSDKQRAYLAELAAGKTQGNVFVSLVENIKDAENAYADSLNAAGSAGREQAAYMDSLQAAINALQESVTLFWQTLIDKGVVSDVIDTLTFFMNFLTQVSDKLGGFATVSTEFFGLTGLVKPQTLQTVWHLFGEIGESVQVVTRVCTLKSQLYENG